ncbi:hypothetical protein COD13_04960 [Priestia megaterium]|uniref:hypothetical protein n=1 Tax=Priestia megaterium TaxID=1404 RepID=UPI000BF820F9|nr:hypothetical protein [Priestia megaterium]PEW19284.1 hypothetical protein CN435_04140 [Priestia megaterium]PGR25004.1 hypothetical protein COC52_19500 [Priestia megaterium]PGT56246.1 hypothetical protein COD13_04960 [Priestia megaterium]
MRNSYGMKQTGQPISNPYMQAAPKPAKMPPMPSAKEMQAMPMQEGANQMPIHGEMPPMKDAMPSMHGGMNQMPMYGELPPMHEEMGQMPMHGGMPPMHGGMGQMPMHDCGCRDFSAPVGHQQPHSLNDWMFMQQTNPRSF